MLAFVLVHAFDLHIKHGFGIDLDAYAVLNQLRQTRLVRLLDRAEFRTESRIIRVRNQVFQAAGVVQKGVADGLAQQFGQLRIGLHQPATRCDAVGFVANAIREHLMQFAEYGFGHQIRVQGGHAIDLVRTDEGQITHAHMTTAVLINQRNRSQQRVVVRELALNLVQQARVDYINDLHVARQHALHQIDRPALQCLRQQGVVGVGHHRLGDFPSFFPLHIVLIDQ